MPMKIHSIPLKPNSKGTIQRKIFNRPKFGVECMYIQLTNTKGIKVYGTLRDARYAHKNQSLASIYQLAPKVYSRVQKCNFNFHKVDNYGAFRHNQKFAYFYITKVAITPSGPTSKEREDLIDNLAGLNIMASDLHCGNLGRIGKKLVAIDFGKESIFQP